jgi:hypothetical protein
MQGSTAAQPSVAPRSRVADDSHESGDPVFIRSEPADSTPENRSIGWHRTCIRDERGLTAEGLKGAA